MMHLRKKIFVLWAVIAVLVTAGIVCVYVSGEVYDGWVGNLRLARALWTGFWLSVIAAAVLERVILANFLSLVKSRNFAAWPWALGIGIAAAWGFSPIGLMNMFGLPVAGVVCLFTLVLLFATFSLFSNRANHAHSELQ
jgi:hypothetical protein